MKTQILLIVTMAVAISAAQTSPPDTTNTDATKRLGVFIGKWKSEGTFTDTPYSKAHKVTSDIHCRWSSLGDFLLCEQLITEPTHQHIQLSMFSYHTV